MVAPCLVWLRRDLRLADNPALAAAARRGGAVVPVWIHAPEEDGDWAPGGASRWWLHQALEALDGRLRAGGSALVLARGPSLEALRDLAARAGADAVYWNRRYEPVAAARDREIAAALGEDGLEVRDHPGSLLFEPGEIRNRQGRPFQVFTPFWRHCLERDPPPAPRPAPARLPAPARPIPGLPLAKLGLLPRPDWAAGLAETWSPGEAGAGAALDGFLDDGLEAYSKRRDLPGVAGTSRLSPHLHFGELSPRQIWHSVAAAQRGGGRLTPSREAAAWLRQLGWREFGHHLLWHFPRTPEAALAERFAGFPWRWGGEDLAAWQQGRTGYPLVDAGMRELWTTGWMHNRVRMVVASFLVKHLLVHWLEGARWFWDTLVDADLANNTLGWQWVAGCGADAAPYFRIFNPVTQGQRFDPEGLYLRHWLPELARLPDRWLHRPWEAPREILAGAEVRLGETYPNPMVDHAAARRRALEALDTVKG